MCVHRASFVMVVLVGLLSGLWAQPGMAQSTVQVDAAVDAHTIGSEERLTYAIRIQGAALEDISTPEPPATSNLVLIDATPATQQYTTQVNGTPERVVTFSWRYRPMRLGAAALKSTDVRIRNQTLATGTIDIEIVPQSERSGAPPSGAPHTLPGRDNAEEASSLVSSDDLFIEVTPTEATVVVGEQISVEYRLYFRPGVRLRQSRMAEAWEAPGFWREELNVEGQPRPDDPDVAYRYIVIKRVATFPTRAGALQIDPLQVRTEATPGFQVSSSNPMHSMQRSFEEVLLSSGPVEVQANPLPEGAPASFDNAVGAFAWTRSAIAEQVAVGEALTFTITVEGTGNLYGIEAPTLDFPDHVDVFAPRVETDLDREGTRLQGTRTFTYTLVPRAATDFTVPAVEWSHFNPETASYITHEAESASVRVKPGMGTAELVADADNTPAAPSESSEWPWGYLLAAIGIIGMLAGGGWVYWAWGAALVAAVDREEPEDHTPQEPAASKEAATASAIAIQQAQRHLDIAQHALREGAPKPFYRALEHAVVGFIGQRLSRSAHGMTHQELVQTLEAHGIDGAVRETVQELLQACDQVQFSPSEPSHDSMLAALDAAHTLVIHLDAALPASSETASQPS